MSGTDAPSATGTTDLSYDRPELDSFTDEASAALHVEVQRYQSELEVKARGLTQNEVVVKQDVSTAIQALRPKAQREGVKVTVDWFKRLGFLFVGFAVAQFQVIRNQAPIERGSVYWLVGHVALAAILLTASIVLDRVLLKSRK